MLVIFSLTVVGGLGLLGLALWPGMLEDAVFSFPFVFLSLPLLVCWFLLLIGLAGRYLVRKPASGNAGRRWGVFSVVVMFVTMGLLRWHVPQRIAFALCRGEFQQLVESAPANGFGDQRIGQQMGLYHVDRYGADRRGGVYFRTHTGPDGIGPDQMSYGFAFLPNSQGSPFGNAQYRYRHLFGEWYVFAASDDW